MKGKQQQLKLPLVIKGRNKNNAVKTNAHYCDIQLTGAVWFQQMTTSLECWDKIKLLAAGNERKQPQLPGMMLWVGMEADMKYFFGDHDRYYVIIVEGRYQKKRVTTVVDGTLVRHNTLAGHKSSKG
jgi:hypothetical protein